MLTPLPPGPVPVGAKVCADAAQSYVPPGVSHITATISWGDGAVTRLRSQRSRACQAYAKAGTMRVRLRLTGRERERDGRKAKRVSAHTSELMDVRTRQHLVLSVSPGLEMLDLNEFGEPYAAQGRVDDAVLSGNGDHVIWGYNTYGLTKIGEVGLVWRNLLNGETIEQPNLTAYGPDISGNGEYVVYAKPSKTAANGYVEAMTVMLWNTRTGKQTVIDRRDRGATEDDGSTTEPRISENGQYVVFASTSQALAPAGETLCTPFVTPGGCNEAAGYIYLYNRQTKTLTPVPPQATFGSSPALRDPVISANGEVVAFHSGYSVEVWYPRTGEVRQVNASDFPCETDTPSLALSGDGQTLAENCMGSVGVVHLGASAGAETIEWTYTFPNSLGYETHAALSANGSVLAVFGTEGPTGWGMWPLWRVELPSDAMELLSVPGAIPGLKAEPKATSGMAEEFVSISANGSEIATVACSIEPPLGGSQECPQRSDVFRWDSAAGG